MKSAVATTKNGGIKDLKQKIEQLTTVTKSSTFGIQKKGTLESPMLPVDNTQVRTRTKNLQAPTKGKNPPPQWLDPLRMDKTLPMLQLWRMGA